MTECHKWITHTNDWNIFHLVSIIFSFKRLHIHRAMKHKQSKCNGYQGSKTFWSQKSLCHFLAHIISFVILLNMTIKKYVNHVSTSVKISIDRIVSEILELKLVAVVWPWPTAVVPLEVKTILVIRNQYIIYISLYDFLFLYLIHW